MPNHDGSYLVKLTDGQSKLMLFDGSRHFNSRTTFPRRTAHKKKLSVDKQITGIVDAHVQPIEDGVREQSFKILFGPQ